MEISAFSVIDGSNFLTYFEVINSTSYLLKYNSSAKFHCISSLSLVAIHSPGINVSSCTANLEFCDHLASWMKVIFPERMSSVPRNHIGARTNSRKYITVQVDNSSFLIVQPLSAFVNVYTYNALALLSNTAAEC